MDKISGAFVIVVLHEPFLWGSFYVGVIYTLHWSVLSELLGLAFLI